MIRVQLGTIWVFLRTMKRGYLENDQVEPGVRRGGGISQRPEVLQAISNSQLETPAKAAKLFGCESQAIPS